MTIIEVDEWFLVVLQRFSSSRRGWTFFIECFPLFMLLLMLPSLLMLHCAAIWVSMCSCCFCFSSFFFCKSFVWGCSINEEVPLKRITHQFYHFNWFLLCECVLFFFPLISFLNGTKTQSGSSSFRSRNQNQIVQPLCLLAFSLFTCKELIKLVWKCLIDLINLFYIRFIACLIWGTRNKKMIQLIQRELKRWFVPLINRILSMTFDWVFTHLIGGI